MKNGEDHYKSITCDCRNSQYHFFLPLLFRSLSLHYPLIHRFLFAGRAYSKHKVVECQQMGSVFECLVASGNCPFTLCGIDEWIKTLIRDSFF